MHEFAVPDRRIRYFLDNRISRIRNNTVVLQAGHLSIATNDLSPLRWASPTLSLYRDSSVLLNRIDEMEY